MRVSSRRGFPASQCEGLEEDSLRLEAGEEGSAHLGTGAPTVTRLDLWALRNKPPGEVVQLKWVLWEGSRERREPDRCSCASGPESPQGSPLSSPCSPGCLGFPAPHLPPPAPLAQPACHPVHPCLGSRSSRCECARPARARRLPTRGLMSAATSTSWLDGARICRTGLLRRGLGTAPPRGKGRQCPYKKMLGREGGMGPLTPCL